jgi:HD-GYP domain-containing protein (c-di-GMP phosphodiesterase class II)
MVCSGIFGYFLIKGTINSMLDLIEQAKAISEGGGFEKIESKHQNELKDLATAFNRITSEMEKRVADLEYSKKVTRELFEKIGYAISSSQKIDSLLALINQGTKKVFEAEASFIVLFDELQEKLTVQAYAGPQKEVVVGAVLPEQNTFIEAVIKGKKPMIIKKTQEKDASNISVTDEPINYSNILCVPIINMGKPRGAIAVCGMQDTEKIESEDLYLMENIANQVAISIANFELNRDIEETYYQTLLTLAKAVEVKDAYSAGHLERVKKYSSLLASKLSLKDQAKKILEGGAQLHDIGKLGIPDKVLNKKDKLTKEEFEIMKQHVIIGADILKPLRSMGKLADLVRHHHEHYDGTGYPDGLQGEQIPLLSRILSVADVYDALITERPYKRALTRSEAVKELKQCSYNILDPKLVTLFTDLLDKEDKVKWQ